MNTQNTVKLIVVLFVMTYTVMSYSDANSFFLTRPDWQPPWCSDLRVKWKDRPCENDVAVEVSYQGQMEGGSRFLFQAYGLPRTSTSRCAKLTLEVKGLEKFGITRLEGFIDGLFEESLSGATFHKTYNFNFIDQEMTQETISRHEESGMGEWDAMYEATKESIEKRGGEVYGRKLYDMVHNVSVGKVTCRIYEKDEADRSDEPVEADQLDEPVKADQLDEPVRQTS